LIEAEAEQYSKAHGVDIPVIPLAELKTHWDSLAAITTGPHCPARAEQLLAENLALKKELAVLRRRFGIRGETFVVPDFLNTDRTPAQRKSSASKIGTPLPTK
jgi:hypothetical protein